MNYKLNYEEFKKIYKELSIEERMQYERKYKYLSRVLKEEFEVILEKMKINYESSKN